MNRLGFLAVSILLITSPAFAEAPDAKASVALNSDGSAAQAPSSLERAKGEKLATAMGHFARSRSLLIAAVRAFDDGAKLVDPSALLDSGVFRETLLDRAEELARVLDPQPRATKGGVKFQADTRLLGEAKK